ncbi:MAG: S53 family peptidase [Caulobacteraceae bacterium]
MASVPLSGSERRLPRGARDVGPAAPDEPVEATLLLRRENDLKPTLKRLGRGERARLSREDFAQQFGATEADVQAVERFAAAHGLRVLECDLARRTVRIGGSVAQLNQAFGVDLRRMEGPAGVYRGRLGAILLPEELAGVVEAVLGLDNRPQAQPHIRPFRPEVGRAAAAVSYTPPQVAALYGFPAGDGAGEAIAIIELGGGFVAKDLSTYFAALGVAPAPKVTAVSVDGAQNQPTGSADGPDGEVMLDIEVAGSLASGASIVVYFAPNTDAGFLDAVTTAAHDTTHRPSVISISWGGPESEWTSQAMTALDQAIAAAGAMGVTVCVASGDSGSSDGVTSGGDHVDFPASSPHALGCGGTSLRASGAAISSETVWNDGSQGGASGGGVSAQFALPTWQSGLSATSSQGKHTALAKRGVPDVSGDADPETGYQVRVDGEDTVFGGTSAVAPLWASLIARINANLGKSVGFINPLLYPGASALNDIVSGDNGDFEAAAGWDACTGLGSPKGAAVQAALG